MKTLLICFSQTGNTRKIAECIKEGIIGGGNECEIEELSGVETGKLMHYDLVGLGSPVFYYKEPFNVRDFIKALPDLTGKYWFIFCTHGCNKANFFPSVTDLLKAKGVIITGYHDCYADAKIPFYPHPTYTTGHPDEIELDEARSFGKEIVQRTRKIADGDVSLIPECEPADEECVETAKNLSQEMIAQGFPRLNVNEDECIECLECEDACPVGGIEVAAEPRRIQDPCIYCWNCIRVCPSAAIEADWDALAPIVPNQYAGYKRYVDEAAAEGKFRWHMDPHTLNLEDPLHRQLKRKAQVSETRKGRVIT